MHLAMFSWRATGPNPLMSTYKDLVRALAYRSGLLSFLHNIRNRDTLTVFMFHRVLPATSGAYAAAEREYTFTREGFAKCLDFIRKHYNLIDVDQVTAHVESGAPLPARAGLITFDDGWRDTAVHALPELEKRQLPGLLFLATSVLDDDDSTWWQDALVQTLAREDNLASLESSLGISGVVAIDRRTRIYNVTAAVGEMSPDARLEFLHSCHAPLTSERQMLSRADVRKLGSISLAGHGHSHVPLTHSADPLGDLQRSHGILQELGAHAGVMSFPHGAVDDAVRTAARRAGFTTCFSSKPVLMDARKPWPDDIGRIHIPENAWTTGANGISPAKLATFLFFRPSAA